MLTTLLLSTMLTTSATIVQQKPNAQEIVVVGQRIRNAEAALRDCIARNCPPDQEIDASLALAETHIVAGKYKDARETLLRALSRNRDEAERYPIPVSDLYRANGRVAAHLGYDRDYYRSTWGIYRTLKKGLPSEQTRHFQAMIEVAEMTGRTRGHDRARLYYADIAREARAANRPDIAAIAELRSAMRHLPPKLARPIISRIAENRDPKMRAPALEASLALARMEYEQNDVAAAEAISRGFTRFNIKKPILIYAPPYQVVEGELANASPVMTAPRTLGPQTASNAELGGGTGGVGNIPTFSSPIAQLSTTKRLPGNFEDMWIDVKFDITPDGRVEGAKIVRSDGALFWSEPLLGSIRGRRYTPTATGQRTARLERYTYTSGYEGKTESRMAGRSPSARIEFFDLSEEGATAQQ